MPCPICNDTGYYTHRTTFPMSYVGPGRCPEDARGMTDCECRQCNALGDFDDDPTCDDEAEAMLEAEERRLDAGEDAYLDGEISRSDWLNGRF